MGEIVTRFIDNYDTGNYYKGKCGPKSEVTDTPFMPTETEVMSSPTVTVDIPSPTETTMPEPTFTEQITGESTETLQSPYEGWVEVVDPKYGFIFRHPPKWTAEFDKHSITLKPPPKTDPRVELNIYFEKLGEKFISPRTGVGAGDLVKRGNVLFLGEYLPRFVLTHNGVAIEVMYGRTGVVKRDKMRFVLSLYYNGTKRPGLSKEIQSTAGKILESFEWIK